VKARRFWAWPLVPLYAAGLAVKDGLRKARVLRPRRLKWPVVSVGSLSAGGAGKTPVVIALAELLRGRGWCVDVLSRGYGRSGSGVERVETNVQGAAARFGDEPVLIAQQAAVPVWVGADRFAAGSAAEANEKACGVHLLDDGFQHRRLARALDVVLVTADDLEDALLPAGNRREGLRALRRADAVVLREEEREAVEARARKFMQAEAVVWGVRRELRFKDSLEELSAGPRPVAFCGIARPAGFWRMLAHAGCKVVAEVAFGDHHAYSAADVERLVKVAEEQDATGFLTTQKDRVKLPESWMERLREIGPVCVVGLEAKFTDEAGVMRELEARCR
jgi:tetraacyldisaccharide 4'-kinase